MNMDLRKLDIFIQVAECKSFSQASKKLHMAQPAVSIAIRKLEDHFGCKLIQRNHRNLSLTQEGEQAYRHAKSLLAQVQQFQDSMQSMTQLLTGEVTLSCPSMLASYHLPKVLNPFLSHYQGLTASVKQAGTQQIQQQLLAGTVELGVVIADALNPALQAIDMAEEQLVLCVERNHALAAQQSVNVEQLDAMPMVMYEGGYYIREKFDALCAQANVKPDIRMQSNFLPLIAHAIKFNVGCGISLAAMPNNEKHLVGIPFRPPVSVRMALAWHKERTLSQANQAFVDWFASNNRP